MDACEGCGLYLEEKLTKCEECDLNLCSDCMAVHECEPTPEPDDVVINELTEDSLITEHN
jgi:hypothetical protein